MESCILLYRSPCTEGGVCQHPTVTSDYRCLRITTVTQILATRWRREVACEVTLRGARLVLRWVTDVGAL